MHLQQMHIEKESFGNLIQESKTINELLHIIHSYVVNNIKIVKSLPIIKKKKNNFRFPITLYGEESELAISIFESFPDDLDVGWTEIISTKNKVLMIVRDRGHALSMEIENDNDVNIIRYFVPKICNRQMVEQLPGIDKITENGARGVFEVPRNQICSGLFDFIGKVPTDDEMETVKTKNKKGIFTIKDAKDLAMRRGKEGTKISDVTKLIQKIKDTFKLLRKKISTKGRGENSNDKSDRDM